MVFNAAKLGVRPIANWMVRSETAWRILGENFTRFGLYLASQRDAESRDRIVENHPSLARILEEGHVLAGPFAGMDYSGVVSFCSTRYPKLLGSYEFELHRALHTLFTMEFDRIVNIGAADGYYTVGLARRFPTLPVIAYEADTRAVPSLRKLCRLNGVDDRVEIRGQCNPTEIVRFPADRSLVIMDCEGYEEVLVTWQTVRHLTRATLVIETHDGTSPGITRRLMAILGKTHHLEAIDAIHDHDRADWIELPEILHSLSRTEVDALLAETRTHACLRWLVATPRKE